MSLKCLTKNKYIISIFIVLLFGSLQPKRTIFDRMEQGHLSSCYLDSVDAVLHI